MKVKVLSEKGQIVSLGYIDQPHNVEDGEGYAFGPIAEDGQSATEVDLPDEFVIRPLTDVTVGDFIKRVQANLKAKK